MTKVYLDRRNETFRGKEDHIELVFHSLFFLLKAVTFTFYQVLMYAFIFSQELNILQLRVIDINYSKIKKV